MKYVFSLVLLLSVSLGIFAQQGERLMENTPNQTPAEGESLYVFTVKMRSGRSVVLAIDDVKIGHFFDGEGVEIAVPDGKHVVRAYQYKWDAKAKAWKDDDDDRLTDTLKGERYPVEVAHGPDLDGGRKTKLDYHTTGLAANKPASPSQSGETSAARVSNQGIEGAVARASVVFVGELPKNSSIAVISISSSNAEQAAFAMDELEYQLVISRQFTMVDRKALDAIRAEQHFQVSGDVSDASAVSIGNLLGANIVITGSVGGTGSTRRLTLKALDVQTAQIVSMARESF